MNETRDIRQPADDSAWNATESTIENGNELRRQPSSGFTPEQLDNFYEPKITLREILLGAFIGVPLAIGFGIAILGWVLAPIVLVAIAAYSLLRQLVQLL